jgi:hypothetical protein
MTAARREAWLQVTAGSGPVECAWAVIKVVEKIRAEAVSAELEARSSFSKYQYI